MIEFEQEVIESMTTNEDALKIFANSKSPFYMKAKEVQAWGLFWDECRECGTTTCTIRIFLRNREQSINRDHHFLPAMDHHNGVPPPPPVSDDDDDTAKED